MSPVTRPKVATASWAIPGRMAAAFGEGGSVLQRYASRFDAVEINSSFYRDHRPQTYERWAAAVHDEFRFAVKMPRHITHTLRLVDTEEAVTAFVAAIRHLGHKLGPVLVQLPPSLRFDPDVADGFTGMLRDRFDGSVAFEPRHASWFTPAAQRLMIERRIARVAADPPPAPQATEPAGSDELAYFRLHGSPRIYYSDYDAAFLDRLATRIGRSSARTIWCVFDNTALGAATENALTFAAIAASALG
ncbi:MAG TPA: DUF72 domain-containing protein [Lichenihabitans sp.]|jgi:uncharacterized protein YecE (DUF72 family)|nr:DUF72 domain-containing protein [Lichenihabitans sp.]